ncbi:MAG: helix-turn-helix transcriptional regulator [Tyzzerella sp.]|nr:helix-turn-helix transcriptional regulator [Tyzzerella sp.]
MKKFREKQRRGTENFPFAYYKENYANHMIKLHWHPEIELLYGIDGELAVNVSEEKFILKPGDILFINPEELHSYKPHTPRVEYHAAVFDAALFQFKGGHFFEQDFTSPIVSGTLKFPRMIHHEHEKYDVVCPIVHRLFNENIKSKPLLFADLTTLFCTLMENELLRKVSDASSYKKSEDIKMCIKYMEDNYTRKITLAELADLVHMSPNYFCNYFKKQTGISPFTQLNYIRVKQAAKLLLNTDDSVVAVAESCGFENVSFFIRKFKAIQGCTPSVYRKGKASDGLQAI